MTNDRPPSAWWHFRCRSAIEVYLNGMFAEGLDHYPHVFHEFD